MKSKGLHDHVWQIIGLISLYYLSHILEEKTRKSLFWQPARQVSRSAGAPLWWVAVTPSNGKKKFCFGALYSMRSKEQKEKKKEWRCSFLSICLLFSRVLDVPLLMRIDEECSKDQNLRLHAASASNVRGYWRGWCYAYYIYEIQDLSPFSPVISSNDVLQSKPAKQALVIGKMDVLIWISDFYERAQMWRIPVFNF